MPACRNRGGGVREAAADSRDPPFRICGFPAGSTGGHRSTRVALQLHHEGLGRVLQTWRAGRRRLLQLPEGGQLRWPEVQVNRASCLALRSTYKRAIAPSKRVTLNIEIKE